MKSFISFCLSAVAATVLLSGCGDFGDINDDPNNPTTAYTSMLFSNAARHTPYVWNDEGVYSDRSGTFVNPVYLIYPQYVGERQNALYGTMNFFSHNMSNSYRYILRNLNEIVRLNTDEATRDEASVVSFGGHASQIGVARTLMGYHFLHLTDTYGMIPYSEALQGEANLTPRLDTQRQVYAGVHDDLKAAYDMMDESSNLDGKYDMLYGGNVARWKRLNATIRLLQAIRLSDVDPETGRAWFVEAYNDGPITDNSDNFVYKYLADADNENPLYMDVTHYGRSDYAPSAAIVDAMNGLNDPRRAVYFQPTADGEYRGIPIGITAQDIAKYKDRCSNFGAAMLRQDAPLTMYSAARVLLVEAEAAVRGWINADAGDLYRRAIAASFAAKGLDCTDGDVDRYMSQEGVAFNGDVQRQLQLIAMQRWINGYFEDGVEAWSDWRRLDYPVFTTGPYAQSLGIMHIPYRMVYNASDRSETPAQYKEADGIQGPDSPDTRLWWDVR